MSEGLNRVTLFGNLGADPELRHLPGGQTVLSMRLATTETWAERKGGEPTGERASRTEWHHVSVWGARATGLSKLLAKGSPVVVEGSLRTTSWEKDGQKHFKTEVVAREVLLVGRRAESTSATANTAAPRARQVEAHDLDVLPF
jgi:single-strand DNA-binding protein